MYQRKISFIGFAVALASMLIALVYFQMEKGLAACDLCMLQRAIIIAFGVVMLVSFLHNKMAWLYGVLGSIISGYGIYVAYKHLLIQAAPEGASISCGSSMEYLYEIGLPPLEILDNVLKGNGDCTKVYWDFLGISIPGWTLMVLIFLLFLSLWLLVQRKK